MKKITLVGIALCLLATMAQAKEIFEVQSPKGRVYLLILMTQYEFDALAKKYGIDNAKAREFGGSLLCGLTASRKGLAKTVYIPYDSTFFLDGHMDEICVDNGICHHEGYSYSCSVLWHEVTYHIDDNIRHPLK